MWGAIALLVLAGGVAAGGAGLVADVGKGGALHINGTSIWLGPGRNGTVYVGDVDVLATLNNVTSAVRALQDASGVPEEEWVETHWSEAWRGGAMRAGAVYGAGGDDAWQITGEGDVRIGPGRNGSVFVGGTDLLAALGNITGKVRALQAEAGTDGARAGLETAQGERETGWRPGGAGAGVVADENGTLHLFSGGDVVLNPGLDGSVLFAGVDVRGFIADVKEAMIRLQALASTATTAATITTSGDGSAAKTLDCADPASRREVADLGAREVASVENCCCEEFYALERVGGDVRVADSVVHLRFGNVTWVDGDIVVPGSFDDRGVLQTVDFGGLASVGSSLLLSDNSLTSVDFGGLTSVVFSLYLSNNNLTSVDFGDLMSVGGDLGLSDNSLTSVDFGGLTSVGSSLYLSNNNLTSVDFGDLTSVGGDLGLSNNNLTSVDFGDLTSVVFSLFLSDNSLTEVDFGSLTSVGDSLWLHNNNLASVDFGDLTSVGFSLALYNNNLDSVDFGGLTSVGVDLALYNNNLASVDFGSLTSVGGDLALYNNNLASVDFGGLTSVGGSLDLSNNNLASVDFGGLTSVDSFLYLYNNTLTSVDFGSLTSVGGSLGLSNNNLASVDFGSIASVDGSLNLSYNALTSVYFRSLASVDVLDISNTRLVRTSALCETFGTRILFARAVPETAFDNATIARCLEEVDLLDLSDNPWLSFPAEVNEAVGGTVVVSDDAPRFLDRRGFTELPARRTPVAFQLQGSPIECSAMFEAKELRPLFGNDTISSTGPPETQLVYSFHCECAQGRTFSNGNCVVNKPNVAAIATGSVFGGLALGLLMMLLFRRYHRLTARLGEHRQLLLESHEEVLALKKAWEISFDELRLIKRVAAGAFGVVYKAEWDTVMVAVKVLQEGVMAFDEGSVEEFEKEVEFLQRTRHPHVVRFFGAGTDPNGSPFLVLEFVALGSLKDALLKGLGAELHKVLEQGGPDPAQGTEESMGTDDVRGEDFTLVTTTTATDKRLSRSSECDSPITTVWDLKLRLLQDVASGMAFIHSLGQVHRDLKSGNVLVSANLRAKITDFGSIRQCFSRKPATRDTAMSGASHDPMYSQALGLATTADLTMTAGVGTPLYMAPEAFSGSTYGARADVFSFGVLMWEVALQRVPDLIEQEKGADFRGPLLSTLDNLLHEGKRLTFADAAAADVPAWYVQVCRRCMSLDPRRRPTFEELNKSVLAP